MTLGYKERQLAIAAQILKHGVFRETLKLYLRCGEMPDLQTIVQIMKQSGIYHIEADSTFIRRSSTVAGWINWISASWKTHRRRKVYRALRAGAPFPFLSFCSVKAEGYPKTGVNGNAITL